MHSIPAHGYPVAYGLIAITAGVLMWHPRFHRKWLHPAAMIMFGFGAAFLAIGITPWEDALASLTGTGTGQLGLVLVTLISAVVFAVEILARPKDDKKRERARIYAYVCAMTFGTTGVLVVANGPGLLRQVSSSPARTGHAFAQAVHVIQAHHAARAHPSHHALVIVIAVAAVVIVVAFAARRHEHRAGRPMANAAPRAITSGPRALPAPNRRGG